ncbi:hypothetical protein F8388_021594 [Cannabis sativa]|uniref:Uncharacterized protein n=1 Tax=Cannabis sativa TaxID=3483 RepID=A0A7J6G8B4_CANSA|nr:hypothetical protein F8388_021594 [Cannabis sativa]KAF4386400.1 hypothetical protein G4B88_020220 [Cannabis sativa]
MEMFNSIFEVNDYYLVCKDESGFLIKHTNDGSSEGAFACTNIQMLLIMMVIANTKPEIAVEGGIDGNLMKFWKIVLSSWVLSSLVKKEALKSVMG